MIRTGLKKYIIKRPHIPRKFKPFKQISRNIGHATTIIKKNKALKKVVKAIFSKKAFKLAVVTSVVGTGAHYIDKYIQSNSGCFLKSGESICKVKELSCCQKDELANVRFCPNKIKDACAGYDEIKENSCCRLCNCSYYPCLPNQSMECRRPTIDEALAYYAGNALHFVWDFLEKLFPWLPWILASLVIGIGVLVAWNFYPKSRKHA